MAIVTLNDIHVAFGPEVVLDKLDLALHPGEKVGMVGANGTGKSTILKLITGQLTPDMGRVMFLRLWTPCLGGLMAFCSDTHMRSTWYAREK